MCVFGGVGLEALLQSSRWRANTTSSLHSARAYDAASERESGREEEKQHSSVRLDRWGRRPLVSEHERERGEGSVLG